MTRAGGTTADARRRRELAAIHAERKRLGIAEADYREAVRGAAEVAGDDAAMTSGSAGDLSAAGRGLVLDMLRRAFGTHDGRDYAGHDERNRQRAADVAPQLAMLRGLWAEGAASGAVRDGSEAALRRLAARVTHVRALEWLTPAQASQLIEAVKAIVARGPARGGGRR